MRPYFCSWKFGFIHYRPTTLKPSIYKFIQPFREQRDAHPHIHTYAHTYIHTYTYHTYIHTYTHTHIHTYIHTSHIHTCMHTYIHICIYTYIHRHTGFPKNTFYYSRGQKRVNPSKSIVLTSVTDHNE
jgi:hypothetical protein